MVRQVWWNGKLIPEQDACLSIYDEALMFGTCIFEMMRTFNRQTFKLQEHIDRLFYSLKILQIDIPYSKLFLMDAHEELVKLHCEEYPHEAEWRTLINVTRGILPLYQEMLDNDGNPNVIIACFPLREILKGHSWMYELGVSLIVPSQRAIPERLLDPKIKSRSRQHYKMADLEVKTSYMDKDNIPLLLDEDGFIAETSGSNFFIAKGDKVYTPEGRNCLRGISRQFIIDMMGRRGYSCQEKNLTLYDAITADEAFITCTPYSIVPVRSVNGHIYNKVPGEMTGYLTDLWITQVKCDFIKQSKGFDNVIRT